MAYTLRQIVHNLNIIITAQQFFLALQLNY